MKALRQELAQIPETVLDIVHEGIPVLFKQPWHDRTTERVNHMGRRKKLGFLKAHHTRRVQLHVVIEFWWVASRFLTSQCITIIHPLPTQNRRDPVKYVTWLQGRGKKNVIVEIDETFAQPIYLPDHAFYCQRVERWQNLCEFIKDLAVKHKVDLWSQSVRKDWQVRHFAVGHNPDLAHPRCKIFDGLKAIQNFIVASPAMRIDRVFMKRAKRLPHIAIPLAAVVFWATVDPCNDGIDGFIGSGFRIARVCLHILP